MSDPVPSPQHTVIARKHRPESFASLVGQSHISDALGNAIKRNRVGHAYLFTGARGVGKTSSARIFAKCLNCNKGPTSEPCECCDSCEGIKHGDDVDVLEIDGASNNGVDEIRQLRSNVGILPSRSPFKIYIIDEVHMLSKAAFNALLKTLEEPPAHVKFIFCTTEPEKIPITILSRCQRFDFSPIKTVDIQACLREITDKEGMKADDAALALLARRAGGSMRDSQSLLEQLFSFCGDSDSDSVTEAKVHQLLGTTDIGRIADLAEQMANQDSLASLKMINEAVADGVDAGQLTTQLLGYFRDMMACHVGCDLEIMLYCNDDDLPRLRQQADKLGLETILTIIQILDAAVMKMQSSVHPQTLLEVSAVRISSLHSLDSLPDLIQALTSGNPVAPPTPTAPNAAPKKNEPAIADAAPATHSVANANSVSAQTPASAASPATPTPSAPAEQDRNDSDQSQPDPIKSAPSETPIAIAPEVTGENTPPNPPDSNAAGAPVPPSPTAVSPSTDSVPPPKMELDPANVRKFWEEAINEIADMTGDIVGRYQKIELTSDKNLVVTLPDAYNRDLCNRPERKLKIESAFEKKAGVRLRIDFLAAVSQDAPVAEEPKLTRRQQLLKLHELPIVKKTLEIFDADIVDYRDPTTQK